MRISWLRKNMALSLAAVMMVSSCAELAYAADNTDMTEEKHDLASLDKINSELINNERILMDEVYQKLEENLVKYGIDFNNLETRLGSIDTSLQGLETIAGNKTVEEAENKVVEEKTEAEKDKDKIENPETEEEKDLDENKNEENPKLEETEKEEVDLQKDIENMKQNNKDPKDLSQDNENLSKDKILENENIVYKNTEDLLAYNGKVLLAKADANANNITQEETKLTDIESAINRNRDIFEEIYGKAIEVSEKKLETGKTIENYNQKINVLDTRIKELEKKESLLSEAEKLELKGNKTELENSRQELANKTEEYKDINQLVAGLTSSIREVNNKNRTVINELRSYKAYDANKAIYTKTLQASVDFQRLMDVDNNLLASLLEEELAILEVTNINKALLEDLSKVDIVVFTEPINLENNIIGKASGKTRIVYKDIKNSKEFLNIGAENLRIENVIFDGLGTHGGITNKEFKVTFDNTDFVNHKSENVINNTQNSGDNKYGQIVFEGKTLFSENITLGAMIYNNDNMKKHNIEEIAMEFRGEVDFTRNSSKILLHTHTTEDSNESIVFKEKVNFLDNNVYDALILNNRLNQPLIFEENVDFINNRGLSDQSVMISHTEGLMEFKGETKFIRNKFGKAILYNGVNENNNPIASKLILNKTAFIENEVVDGSIIVDHATTAADEDNRIRFFNEDGETIYNNLGNGYNEKVYPSLIVLNNRASSVMDVSAGTFGTKIPENMKKQFLFKANGGVFLGGASQKQVDNVVNVRTVSDPTRSGYTFQYWSPSSKAYNDISLKLNSSDSQELSKMDLTSLYDRYELKEFNAQWKKIEEPVTDGGSSGGGGGGRDKDKNKDKDKEKEKPKEEEKPKEQLIDGRPISEVIKDYENATGEAKRELREQLMGVTIETGSEYKFKKEQHAAYLEGYKDSTFRPDRFVTREEVASVILRILEPRFVEEVETTSHKFADVESGRWSEKAIATLANGEIMNGYGDGTFRPNVYITRAELSRTVSRFTDIIIEETKFEDIIAHWAEDYINSARREGWIKGYDDGSFKPDNLITRAELTALINSMLERKVSRENILEGAKTYNDLDYDKWYYPVIIEAINGHHHDINELKEGSEIWVDLVDDKFF